MVISKSIVQFFFGATNQDTSKKGVKQGDLITARNMQQLHPGEFVKRGGMAQYAQTYAGLGATFAPDSISSPDGVQVLTREPTTDTMLARSSDATHHANMGSSLRIMADPTIRFPATSTGKQSAPMAKQAGDYYVWLDDAQHFMIAKRSTDSEAELATLGPVAVAGPGHSGGTILPDSAHVSSFAAIDSADFDTDNLWVFWVDCSTNAGAQQNRDGVWGMKVPHTLVGPVTFYEIHSGTQSNLMFTGISATILTSGLMLAVCGCHPTNGGPDTYANYIGFRVACSSVNTALLCLRIYVTGEVAWSSTTEKTSTAACWTASGVCHLSIKTIASFRANHFYVSLWAGNATSVNSADLVVVDSNESGSNDQTWHILATVDNTGYIPVGSPDHPFFIGSTTGHEVAPVGSGSWGSGGAYVVAQYRIFYHYGSPIEYVDPVVDYPDQIFTKCYEWFANGTSPYLLWTVRGAWIAQGWFKWTDGTELLITGWQDGGELQTPYHLRRLDTGAILAQFAYGQGPYAGGCSDEGTQIANAIADIQQPMLGAAGYQSELQILLTMQSSNIAGSVDIANVALSKPAFQNPTIFASFALSPGPVPTVVDGWQRLREAGPLVYPSKVITAFGTGST